MQRDLGLLALHVSSSVEMSGKAQAHSLSFSKRGFKEGLFAPSCQICAFPDNLASDV